LSKIHKKNKHKNSILKNTKRTSKAQQIFLNIQFPTSKIFKIFSFLPNITLHQKSTKIPESTQLIAFNKNYQKRSALLSNQREQTKQAGQVRFFFNSKTIHKSTLLETALAAAKTQLSRGISLVNEVLVAPDQKRTTMSEAAAGATTHG
jgi:hypothetical protein